MKRARGAVRRRRQVRARDDDDDDEKDESDDDDDESDHKRWRRQQQRRRRTHEESSRQRDGASATDALHQVARARRGGRRLLHGREPQPPRHTQKQVQHERHDAGAPVPKVKMKAKVNTRK